SWQTMGMDRQRLPALSPLPESARCHWRIQRQVHGQPDGTAGRIVCLTARTCPQDLPEFLSTESQMAIHRNPACPTPHSMKTGILDKQFAADVKAGLTASPKFLSSKYFYDKNGDK